MGIQVQQSGERCRSGAPPREVASHLVHFPFARPFGIKAVGASVQLHDATMLPSATLTFQVEGGHEIAAIELLGDHPASRQIRINVRPKPGTEEHEARARVELRALQCKRGDVSIPMTNDQGAIFAELQFGAHYQLEA